METERLNKLFNAWEKEYPIGTFCRDGIINESYFTEAKKKILFITKEPNDPSQSQWDFREVYNREISPYPFCYRITEWSYGILNEFKQPIEDVWKNKDHAHLCLKSIAMMNIKKSGGKGYSNINDMLEYSMRDIDFIREEIKIIDPEIIILGTSWKKLRNFLLDKKDWSHSGYYVAIGRYDKAKVIDFYHPSSRNAPSAAYSLLQNIIKSAAFKKL